MKSHWLTVNNGSVPSLACHGPKIPFKVPIQFLQPACHAGAHPFSSNLMGTKDPVCPVDVGHVAGRGAAAFTTTPIVRRPADSAVSCAAKSPGGSLSDVEVVSASGVFLTSRHENPKAEAGNLIQSLNYERRLKNCKFGGCNVVATAAWMILKGPLFNWISYLIKNFQAEGLVERTSINNQGSHILCPG